MGQYSQGRSWVGELESGDVASKRFESGGVVLGAGELEFGCGVVAR